MTKILVADDERVVLLTLAEGLREAGFDVVEARDGLQALALCRSEKPDLAQRLRDETTVPFLFFSAYGDEAMVQRAVEIGALGYLIKPLQVASIVPMIRTALARSKDISGLQGALASNRTIATAVGMLMRAEGLDQPAAFDRLRGQARSQRRKLEDVARLMIDDNKLLKS